MSHRSKLYGMYEEEGEFETEVIEGLEKATSALRYYIDKVHNLEHENKVLREAYNNRVEEFLKLSNEISK